MPSHMNSFENVRHYVCFSLTPRTHASDGGHRIKWRQYTKEDPGRYRVIAHCITVGSFGHPPGVSKDQMLDMLWVTNCVGAAEVSSQTMSQQDHFV